jgi:hypothetical protein
MIKIKKIITADLKSFFYVIPMKIQSLVISCDEFLYACIVEICCHSIESVFNHLLHFLIAVRATQNLLEVCEQVKITCSKVQTVERMKKKKMYQVMSASSACALEVFTFWMAFLYVLLIYYVVQIYSFFRYIFITTVS